jgi:uncharacterized protein YjbI with pentapeptide repeats
MSAPEMKKSRLFKLLREGKIDEFNEAVAKGEKIDLENANLRSVDLRGVRLEGICLRGAYLCCADLRGLDLRFSNLEGASLKGARISGVWFQDNISAEEIRLSFDHGTRLRVARATGHSDTAERG